MRRQAVTIEDVALKSAVSKATASLALNGRPGLKPETVARVLEAARELGFSPNESARRMGSAGSGGARTMMIGFLCDHQIGPAGPDPFHFNILLGVQRAAQAASYHVVVGMNQSKPAEQLDYVRGLSNGGVDGWVLADSASKEVVEFLGERQIPKVIAGDSTLFPGVTSIHGDSIGGAGMATRHLIDIGHRRIGFAGWERSHAWSSMRLAGYLSALGGAGIVPNDDAILFANDLSELEPWLRGFIDNDATPTAIVAATDWIAVESLKVAARLGIRVPEQLSVIGFDDVPWLAHLVAPALSSVHVSIDLIGETAFRYLLDEIKDVGSPGMRMALPVHLVLRDSTAPPSTIGD